MTITIPLLVALVGAFMMFSSNSKFAEMGRIFLLCGTLVALMGLQGHPINFLR
jgi:hypothetical protein